MTDVLTGLALVVVLSVAARLIASALRIPTIVPLLIAGAVAGGVTGLIEPPELLGDALTPIVSLAVGIVLFEGALKLRWSDLADGSHRVMIRLITIGVGVTWGLTFLALLLLLDLPTELSLLIAAVLIVSGPTVVLPMLDFIRPGRTVRTVLRWEGILVDPVGAIIAVVIFGGLTFAADGVGFHPGEFALTLTVGAAVGALAALILMPLLGSNRLSARDKVAAGLMMVVAAFAGADAVFEDAGLAAVIVAGLVLANQRRIDIDRLVEFSETLVPLLIGVLFVLLAANVDLDAVVDLGLPGIALVLAIVLVVRPLATLASTVGSSFNWRERAFIAAMAPKGIVAASTASVFGLQLVDRGVDGAEQIVPITFLVIAGTVLVYALGSPPLARLLGVARVAPPRLLVVGAPAWVLRVGRVLVDNGVEVLVWPLNENDAEAVRRAGLEVAPDPLLGNEMLEDDLLEGVSAILLVSDDDALNQLLAAQFNLRLDAEQIYVMPPRPGSRHAVSVHTNPLFSSRLSDAEEQARMAGAGEIRAVDLAAARTAGVLSIAAVSFGRGNRPARIHVASASRPAHAHSGDIYVVAEAEPPA